MTDSELTDAAFALKDQGGNSPLEDYFETLCEMADQPASVLFPRLVSLSLAHSSDAELLDLTFGE